MGLRLPPTFHRSPVSILTATARRPPPTLSPRTILPLGLGLGLGYTLLPSPLKIRFDDAPFSTSASSSGPRGNNLFSGSSSSSGKGDGPLGLDDSTIKQITTGSILGLVAGLAISMFSRTLAILIGVGVVVVQYAAGKGIKLVPAETIQKYVKGFDVKRALHSNPAMKISFGITFALAAFGSF